MDSQLAIDLFAGSSAAPKVAALFQPLLPVNCGGEAAPFLDAEGGQTFPARSVNKIRFDGGNCESSLVL